MKSVFSKNFIRIILVMIMFSFAGISYAASWETLRGQIKSKYENIMDDVVDMQILMDIKTSGDGEEMNIESKFYSKGDKYRIESEVPIPGGAGMPGGMKTMQTIIVCDGNEAWSFNPFQGKQKLPSKDQTTYTETLFWWEREASEDARITGSEKVDGRDCYVVEVIDESGKVENKVWIDKGKLILLKGEDYSGETTSEIFFSDFKTVMKGWEMPHTIKAYEGGKVVATIIVEKFQVNKGLSDDLFNPDKVEMKKMNMMEMMKKFKEGK